MIPKIIYRSWKTQNFHPKIQRHIDKMLKLNSEYEQIIYTDDQINDFVSSNYDQEIYNAYSKLNIITAKVDFWRYLILYKNGGIYLDIDSQINSKISNFLKEDDKALITAETNPELFVQWALFFEKNHPILERTISKVVENINMEKFPNDIVNTTGPGVYTSAIKEIYYENYKEDLNWNKVDKKFNKIFNINSNNLSSSFRIFGVDFNGFLSFKYKNTKHLYNNSLHWKKEESFKKLIN